MTQREVLGMFQEQISNITPYKNQDNLTIMKHDKEQPMEIMYTEYENAIALSVYKKEEQVS